LGIFEILLFLVIALIVIPPDDLPQVMRAVGKVVRELRLASNTVMREISSAIGEDSPFNILPPRFDDPPVPTPPAESPPPARGFLAPESQVQPPAQSSAATEGGPQAPTAGSEAGAPPAETAAVAPPASAANHRATGALSPADRQAAAETTPPDERRLRGRAQPEPRKPPAPSAEEP
jgi:hypothetical protein